MIHITLPCCDASVAIDQDATIVRCEACSVEHDFPADGPAHLIATAVPALAAA